ncbi:23S rRNA m(5)U-747 methyltransferase [Sediminihabitans luteus]|uniref:23S rRNA m(5)U-747 methyltransferase n=1 Tax=Sediminihabitans luteus TaxID=1138585 RepID=A0A2M9D1P2_9CELL|nr:23S rRNA (uracil(747)-C(5))-methyltransferase RlmC [Sediminihabitans luteus]PJJ77918.1 23S rRNA m(5)U-747 methyltransferase [Sediminihabitans luteus]GII99725.1 23S rRNA (uracil(747)-C(5))-methyltransferase RlmC [Sediminihabitans luteus]
MHCHYFAAGRCGSCTLMEQPYAEQLAAKQSVAAGVLGDRDGLVWLDPHASRESGFRNKAKMVVGGTVDAPTVGILDPDGHGVDLRDCGLYTPGIHAALPALAAFVTRAAIAPYDVPARRGELKNLLLTESPDGELMLRFVLRSQEPVARIRKHLPWLLDAVPGLRVVSVNLLPEHRAVVEGEREIVLTDAETLTMRLNGIGLHLRPQSFFQTNTEVAAALYRGATSWLTEALARAGVADGVPARVWDLYCGVGGFALHVARALPDADVTGIEVSAEAIESARTTARDLGLGGESGARVRFAAGDATGFAVGADAAPDVVVVNPPRRGLGADLCARLETSSARWVVYSSCNPASLARDLDAMPSLRPVRAQLFDMFPQTTHAEVLVLLERRPSAQR